MMMMMDKVILRPKIHNPFPTFNGSHNLAKSLCLLTLGYYQNQDMRFAGLTARELADASGANYLTVKTRVGLWCKWGYLKRHESLWYGYRYTLTARGLQWTTWIPDRVVKIWFTNFINSNKKRG